MIHKDILVITKPKNLHVNDVILTFKDKLNIITITDKNLTIDKDIKVIGKIIELSRNI